MVGSRSTVVGHFAIVGWSSYAEPNLYVFTLMRIYLQLISFLARLICYCSSLSSLFFMTLMLYVIINQSYNLTAK